MAPSLLPPIWPTSTNLSASNFSQSSLSFLDRSRLRMTLLKISLSFNLLFLSRTESLAVKLHQNRYWFWSIFFYQFWIFQQSLSIFVFATSFRSFDTLSLDSELGNIFFQILNYDVVLPPPLKVHCLFPSLFLFLSPSPELIQHPLWGCLFCL